MDTFNYGANLIENLTTGLYQDSKVIFREYIQNACDQIDKAEELGILRPRDPKSKYPDLGQGVVNIWLYPRDRKIIVEDNATGIKELDFKRVMGSVGDSDKELGKDKGFRGIGRLCGLAYCKRLVFTTRWNGESNVSVMACDALKMRQMINETNMKVQRYSINDVLTAMTEFSAHPTSANDPEHFFRVELIDINNENEELFGGRDEDNIKQLTDYLSFVAPVPYQANFLYRSEIYEHAKKLGTRIDEYDIRINGESIYKKYKTHLNTGNGQDDVYGVEFCEIKDDDGTLLAWLWYGKTNFIAAIREEEISRGLRLRKENIQIGEDDTLRGFFTREASKRGNNYFIGEVFAVSKELIPNSQRAYFNENPVRIRFEHKLKDYFNNTLYYIYYEGSDINSKIKKIASYQEKASEFKRKESQGGFLNPEEKKREVIELERKKKEAEDAKEKLIKKQEGGRSILTSQIIKRRADEFKLVQIIAPTPKPQTQEADERTEDAPSSYGKRQPLLIDKMFPCANKKERKLISETLDKIFRIIEKSMDKKTSDAIIKKIKDELK